VIEETPESISIRCSVDSEDFTINNLIKRLENTGSTMRSEAIKALLHGNPELAQRAINRERQANKIFVLILRIVFTSYQNPRQIRAIGLETGFPLIGYRSVAKNLELTADNAEDIATIVLETEDHTLDIDQSTLRSISEYSTEIDALSSLAIEAVAEQEYDMYLQCTELFRELQTAEQTILSELPELENADLLAVRQVLVSLHHTAEYAVRNAEIAANFALSLDSEYVTIE